MKKLISVILALVMLFTLMAPCASAVTEERLPIVYIRGNGETIYGPDGNPVGARLEDMMGEGEDGIAGVDKDAIVEAAVNILLPLLTEGLIFDKWDTYGRAIYDEVAPLFKNAALDSEGNSPEGVGVSQERLKQSEAKSKTDTKYYNLYDYEFCFDWRLSPYDHVDRLDEYIQNIKAATGKSQVCIYVRCFGGSLAMAYLEKYGSKKDVARVMFTDVLSNGTAVVSDAFSGKVEFDAAYVQRYLGQLEQCDALDVGQGFTLTGLTNEIVFKTLDLFTKTGTADMLLDGVEGLYEKLYKSLLPALCFATGIATQVNYWTCVYEEDFDAALDVMFGSEEAQEAYPGVIRKIKEYREKVTSKLPELYKTFSEDYGIRIGVSAKYGYMNVPFIESMHDMTDSLVSVKDAAFGVTCADINTVLSDKDIAGVDEKYISADRKINTSTCIFPETTWVIKNAHHDCWELSDAIGLQFLRSKDMTVDSYAQYPTFMRFYEETRTYEPLTTENCEDYDWYSLAEDEPTTESILVSMMRWFKMIFEILTKLLKGELELGSLLNKDA
ncbi:MAG: hypothetical protein E7543_06870 [Ruminococcaceae bacterium]|nr:hypothetical protein [Oscillospiraceae bacterium]